MRKLSLIIALTAAFVIVYATMNSDNPHGIGFRISCSLCHSANSWKLDKTIYAFEHDKTAFPLTGLHASLDCRSCHPTLVFSDAKTACADCHPDMHYQTVGPDCARCHTTRSWIVENITELHQRSRFPLTGPHKYTDCSLCHKSSSLLRFEPLGVSCYDCHRDQYMNAKNPDHVAGNFSKDCLECHAMNGITWSTMNVSHSFFPLTLGHSIDCSNCHKNGGFGGLSTVCVTCHQANYDASTNPPHHAAGIPTTCADCHTTNPGWKPATFAIHNAYYALTGAHQTVDCNSCHHGNYATTPNTCVGCHQSNYDASTNPPHRAANIPTTCADCHTTNPGWKPATFAIHNSYYPLTGAHISVTCQQCHNGNYVNTPNTCVGCHQTDYNQANNPPHAPAQFPTDCQMCHTTAAWSPSTFNHDSQYFPIYSGHHAGTWTLCSDCHSNPANYQVFSCIDCHAHNNQAEVDSQHQGVAGYTYTSAGCYSCHPTGSAGGKVVKPQMKHISPGR